MDLAALDAGEQLIALLGRDNARAMLRILELPHDERLAFIARMF